MLDTIWVIISTPSIISPNVHKSSLNSSSSVIQSSGSLVTQYNSLLKNFLHSLVLDSPVIGLNVLFNIYHAYKAPHW